MVTFEVYVPEFNAEKFKDDYNGYITNSNESIFGDYNFTLTAPAEVYQEIIGLKEEGIQIVVEDTIDKAIQYVKDNKTWSDWDEQEALDYMNEMRCDIYRANSDICWAIADLMDEYGKENDLPEGWWVDEISENDIFLKL